MQILEYDDVDPLAALHLSLSGLDFALTPEYAAQLRRTDPRPFPCLAIYAVEDNTLVGQAGLYQQPMLSTAGREEVGGVWAVATNGRYAGNSVVSRLLDEAHSRMRAVGMRFSTLNTKRNRVHYNLYRQHGYVDMQVWATALARWETAHRPSRLHARPPGEQGYQLVDQIIEQVAGDYLGFVWRYTPFGRLDDPANVEDIWIIWQNERPIGCAFVRKNRTLLDIYELVLQFGIDITEAVASVVAELKSDYVQIKISRPADLADLQRAGWRVTHPSWDSFMVKPLTAGVTVDTARQLFSIGTDRFLISWLDTS